MSENNNNNGAHPGVRSLLAKFENSPSNVTSPPSRGRSPVASGSDTPGSARQLSRVRASFVTVEGAIQSTQGSNQGSPLRKTSGPSDESSMFGPQINEQGIESRRENVVSPTPGGQQDGQPGILDSVAKKETSPAAPTVKVEQLDGKDERPAVAEKSDPAVNVLEAKKELKPNGEAPAGDVPQKTGTKTVTKRPSNIHSSNANAPSKATSTTASAPTKQAASSARSTSTKDSAKERTGTLVTKSSRASLNPGAKSTARTTRGSTPAQEASKSSPPSNKTRAKSPTKPVRLPSSMTAPTQASAARLGTSGASAPRTSTSGATLTRKPSSLKSAAPTQTRPAAGATSGVRRQASRPSLPTQPAAERPSSRVSDGGSGGGTKPVNEGFLARMMRPTASSASKSHDRPETKVPQKASTSPKAPRQSLSKAPERSAAPAKPKTAPLKPQAEKRQAPKKETAPPKESEGVKPSVQEHESGKENIEVPPSIPEEKEIPTAQQTVVEEPEKEVPAEPTADSAKEEKVEAKEVEPAVETAPEAIEEPIAQPSEEPAAEPLEPLVQEKATFDGASDAPVVEEPEAPKETQAPAVTEPEVKEEEISVEAPAEPKTGDAAADDQPETSTDGYSTPLLDLGAVADQEETPKPALGEVSESKPTASLIDTSDEPTETLKDINVPAPSTQPEEPTKESTSTEKPATETEPKATADEIDFQSLTLT